MDHRSLEREAQRANDFLQAALVYDRKGTQRPVDGIEAAKAAWRAKVKANPKTRPGSILEEITAIAVEADDAARAASRAYYDAVATQLDKVQAIREAAAEAEVERRRALRDERAEKELRRGL